MTERYIKDGHIYTKSNGRLVYTPALHHNRYKPWKVNDLIYLCGMYEEMKCKDIALCLGRTEGSCCDKVAKLRKIGEFESFVRRFKEEYGG
ncbi:hypothetical protein [Fusobacterium ulcerans]|uniref:hypothetical protein n=1 Tax=Fusobacterium ulcerans TaxID=861 RepID=UPI0027B8A3D6|nr:hypothetical protein [Fusobacterium ulcerans]